MNGKASAWHDNRRTSMVGELRFVENSTSQRDEKCYKGTGTNEHGHLKRKTEKAKPAGRIAKTSMSNQSPSIYVADFIFLHSFFLYVGTYITKVFPKSTTTQPDYRSTKSKFKYLQLLCLGFTANIIASTCEAVAAAIAFTAINETTPVLCHLYMVVHWYVHMLLWDWHRSSRLVLKPQEALMDSFCLDGRLQVSEEEQLYTFWLHNFLITMANNKTLLGD